MLTFIHFQFLYFSFFLVKFIYLFLFIFDCVGSSLQCAGCSLWWLLLLRSTGSRHVGFGSCGSRALECRLSSYGARAQLFHSMWDLLGPGLEPVFPALAGGFSTTAPPGKSLFFAYFLIQILYSYVFLHFTFITHTSKARFICCKKGDRSCTEHVALFNIRLVFIYLY